VRLGAPRVSVAAARAQLGRERAIGLTIGTIGLTNRGCSRALMPARLEPSHRGGASLFVRCFRCAEPAEVGATAIAVKGESRAMAPAPATIAQTPASCVGLV
jgi:hypothetical protein